MPGGRALSVHEMMALVVTDDLLTRARAGQSEAWGQLVERFAQRVRVVLLADGLSLAESQDVAQEAWASIWLKHQRGELPDLQLPGLVIAHARFLAKDARRRAQRVGPMSSERDEAQAVDLRLGAAQDLRRVRETLAQRSPQQQRIFSQAVEDLWPHAEIARAEGLSLQRVRQILWEVRCALRAVLEAEQERS